MACFFEVKKFLSEIFCVEMDEDENCDLIVPLGEGTNIVFSNNILRDAYDKMKCYSIDRLEISTTTYREVALQFFNPSRCITEMDDITDSINGLTYSIGLASPEYCMLLLDSIVESARKFGRKIYIDLRHRSRLVLRRNMDGDTSIDPMEILKELMRAYTLKIRSERPVIVSRLREYAASFEFHFMYKQNTAVSEYTDVQDMYSIGNSMLRYTSEDIDSPPRRIYNAAVLDYYTMALESRDPFTMYISFYHIVEHYFDAVFRKKLTQSIKNKMTRPDFSYKSEDNLYDLAKYIRKHMSSDDDSGKGNEFESLRYVLMEYVPIDELKSRINCLVPNAVNYYQSNLVPFATSGKTKINWSDTQGVYTNLATRIYETRNALVHSKSEQLANQYRPYENKKDLISEIALIKACTELVVINSSEVF